MLVSAVMIVAQLSVEQGLVLESQVSYHCKSRFCSSWKVMRLSLSSTVKQARLLVSLATCLCSLYLAQVELSLGRYSLDWIPKGEWTSSLQ